MRAIPFTITVRTRDRAGQPQTIELTGEQVNLVLGDVLRALEQAREGLALPGQPEQHPGYRFFPVGFELAREHVPAPGAPGVMFALDLGGGAVIRFAWGAEFHRALLARLAELERMPAPPPPRFD